MKANENIAKGQQQQTEQQQQRVAMLPSTSLQTVYVNSFQTNFNRTELLLTGCVTRKEKDKDGSLLVIQPQVAIAMSPVTMKSMAMTLRQVIERYEEQFGEIK